jgi:hypothetical protein
MTTSIQNAKFKNERPIQPHTLGTSFGASIEKCKMKIPKCRGKPPPLNEPQPQGACAVNSALCILHFELSHRTSISLV